jgi:hypothetical protein
MVSPKKPGKEEKKYKTLNVGPLTNLATSQEMLIPGLMAAGKYQTSSNKALQVTLKEGITSVSIDSSKLKPPEKQYVADSFTIATFIGYSDLYFGNKSPKARSGDLLNCIAVRIPNRVLKDLVFKGHKNFYEPLLEKFSINKDYRKQFRINLEEQFPLSHDSQHFVFANFVYAAHGADMGEIMFYKISPSHIHHLATGKQTIIDPKSDGIEGIITITVPISLLAYFYKMIIEKKNGLR